MLVQNLFLGRIRLNCLLILVIMAFASTALAERSKYEEPFVDPTAETDAAKSGEFFLGGYMSLGQVRSTEPDASSGMVYLVGFDPGYMFSTGSWSRFEVGAELFFGKVNFRLPDEAGGKIELPIGFGVLAKVGLGHSLGNKLFGTWKLGVGMAQGKYSAKTNSVTRKSKDPVTGLAVKAAYDITLPMSDSLEAFGGFSWTYMEFDLDDLEAGGQTYAADRPVIINMPQVAVGLRLKI